LSLVEVVVVVRLGTEAHLVAAVVAGCWPAQRHSKPAFLTLCALALAVAVARRRVMAATLY
jgi:hypothetical protein